MKKSNNNKNKPSSQKLQKQPTQKEITVDDIWNPEKIARAEAFIKQEAAKRSTERKILTVALGMRVRIEHFLEAYENAIPNFKPNARPYGGKWNPGPTTTPPEFKNSLQTMLDSIQEDMSWIAAEMKNIK